MTTPTNNLYERLLLEQISTNPQNLMMLPSIFWSKHHGAFKHKYFDRKFDVMNNRYFGSEEFKENMLQVPLVHLKSSADYSKAEKWELLKKSPLVLIQFDLDECSKNMIDYALEQKPELISMLNSKIQTEERVRKALEKNGLVLGFILEEYKTYKNCKIAVNQNIYAIKYVPEDLLDDYFVNLIKSSSEWVLDLLPSKFARNDELQDHFYKIDKLKAFNAYMEISATSNDQIDVYNYLKAVVENNYKGYVFQDMSASFYVSEGFNTALLAFMNDHGPEIIYYFDLDQLHEIHIQNAIIAGEVFKELPSSVWNSIFPKLIENKTEQLFYLPFRLKSLLNSVSVEVLNFYLQKVKEKPELIIPNFIFDEMAYKGELDQKIIQYSPYRKVCEILVNGQIDDLSALELINEENTTLYEIQLLENHIDSTKIGRLFKNNPIWYPLLAIKDVESSIRFAKAFPMLQKYVDEDVKKDDVLKKEILETNPEFFDF